MYENPPILRKTADGRRPPSPAAAAVPATFPPIEKLFSKVSDTLTANHVRFVPKQLQSLNPALGKLKLTSTFSNSFSKVCNRKVHI